MTKILLVEDDKSLREIYSVRLLAEGYTLISSGDGEEALAAAIGEKPDLIISDVMMPKISGFEMLDLLRSNDSTKDIPVIMLTALSSEQQRERGNRLGADRYLIKSQVGIEDIVRTVHEVLHDANRPRSVGQLQESIARAQAQAQAQNLNRAQAQAVNGSAESRVANATSTNMTNGRPIASNPSIAGTNFNGTAQAAGTPATRPTGAVQPTAAPMQPGTYQSSFNPLSATDPAKAVGQPEPKLPDTPMHIPSRTVPQPNMSASFTAASQTVANFPGISQQSSANDQYTQAPAASQSPNQLHVLQQPTMTNPTTTQMQMQQQFPQSPVSAPLPTSMPPAPQPQPATFPNANGLADSELSDGPQITTTAGGERTIQPIPGTATSGPKINIDELLASADASSSPMFPGQQ